jgi:hypothetical protein
LVREGFRFDPPELELEPEVRWLLVRAFGREGEPAGEGAGLDLARLLDLGTWMDLLPRIGARTDAELLDRELGGVGAEDVRQRYRGTAALALQSEGLAGQIGRVATDHGIPVVFLKGMAMHLHGIIDLGSRGSCDVDLLVPTDRAETLQTVLLESGYRDPGMPPSEHQLAPIVHPAGIMVEVHTMVWGVRLDGSDDSATAQVLLERGLCEEVERFKSGCYVPIREVLLAHLLVHGVAQHGLSPMGYPMTRMVADVQDLGPGEDGWQAFDEGPYGWIAPDVSQREVAAVAGLAKRLRSGVDPAGIAAADSDQGRLLRHVVAGFVDDSYRSALKMQALGSPLTDKSRSEALAAAAVKALWLGDAQIDAIYGRPKGRLGYWGRRMWRPFDLVLRAVRYTGAWIKHRIR